MMSIVTDAAAPTEDAVDVDPVSRMREDWGDRFIMLFAKPSLIETWTVEELKRSPKSVVSLHTVTWKRTVLQALTGKRRAVKFIEKLCLHPVECEAYKILSKQDKRFSHAPRLYDVQANHGDDAATLPHRLLIEYIEPSKQIFETTAYYADLVAEMMFQMASLKPMDLKPKGYDYERTLRELQDARKADTAAAIYSRPEWANTLRRATELSHKIKRHANHAVPAHGDLHFNNMFVYPKKRGKAKPVRVIDWERFSLRPAGWDLYHFLSRSLLPESNGTFYAALTREYEARLGKLGIDRREMDIGAYSAVLRRTAISFRTHGHVPDTVAQNKYVMAQVLDKLEACLPD